MGKNTQDLGLEDLLNINIALNELIKKCRKEDRKWLIDDLKNTKKKILIKLEGYHKEALNIMEGK